MYTHTHTHTFTHAHTSAHSLIHYNKSIRYYYPYFADEETERESLTELSQAHTADEQISREQNPNHLVLDTDS